LELSWSVVNDGFHGGGKRSGAPELPYHPTVPS
jgi:hypothetical protein